MTRFNLHQLRRIYDFEHTGLCVCLFALQHTQFNRTPLSIIYYLIQATAANRIFQAIISLPITLQLQANEYRLHFRSLPHPHLYLYHPTPIQHQQPYRSLLLQQEWPTQTFPDVLAAAYVELLLIDEIFLRGLDGRD